MGEMEFLGLLIVSIITLGGFIALVLKFTQPINELRVVIQKLIDKLDTLSGDTAKQETRLNDHDNHFVKLDGRVDKLETRMDMYHHDN